MVIQILQLFGNHYRVCVTGHSLGGSVASALAG
jgi:predicted dienelactone hydrolase